jgi:hypothetical protein
LGTAPGANIGDEAAVFEATHGTAPRYSNQDMINPGSLILSGAMMFDYLGWGEVTKRIVKALEKTISEKTVTYDLGRQMRGAKKKSSAPNSPLPSLKAFDKLSFFKLLLIKRKLEDEPPLNWKAKRDEFTCRIDHGRDQEKERDPENRYF